jgi:hypothetical protein
MYGGMDVYIHIFLTLAIVGGEWSASGGRAPGTHWIGGWMVPRTGLDNKGKRKFLTLPGLELRIFSHPTRTQSLYQLRYPSSLMYTRSVKVQQLVGDDEVAGRVVSCGYV